MRKFQLNRTPATESALVEPQMTNEVIDPTIDTEICEVSEYSDGLEELSETTEALESLIVSMESSLAEGGLTRQALGFAQMHAKHLAENIGLECLMPSFESAGSRVAATESAIGAIKEVAVKTVKAIWEFLIRLFNAGIDKLKQFRTWFSNKSQKVVEKLKQMPPEDYSKIIEIPISYFTIHNKVSTDLINDFVECTKRLDFGEPGVGMLLEIMKTANSNNFQVQIADVVKNAYNHLDRHLKFDRDTDAATTIFCGRQALHVAYNRDLEDLHRCLFVVRRPVEPDNSKTSFLKLGIQPRDIPTYEKFAKDYDALLEKCCQQQEFHLKTAKKLSTQPTNLHPEIHSKVTNSCINLITKLTNVSIYGTMSLMETLKALSTAVDSAYANDVS